MGALFAKNLPMRECDEIFGTQTRDLGRAPDGVPDHYRVLGVSRIDRVAARDRARIAGTCRIGVAADLCDVGRRVPDMVAVSGITAV